MCVCVVVPPLQAIPYLTKFPVPGMRNLPALLLLDKVQYKGLQKQFGPHPLPLLAVIVLSRKVSYSLWYLNTWSISDGALCGDSRGVVLLEEIRYWAWALKTCSLPLLLVSFVFKVKMRIPSFLFLHPVCHLLLFLPSTMDGFLFL